MKSSLVLSSVGLWLLAGACGETEPSGPRPNIILISIDTLRADHLGCYGYPRPTSPAIDELCRDSVVFAQAIAQAPSTLHSHASMLTSLLPHHHQASWAAKTRLPEEALTLAEVLREAGHRTMALTEGGQLDRVFGLNQGFELYHQLGDQDFDHTVRRALKWMKRRPNAPFFMFLHSYEVHSPYDQAAAYLDIFEDEYSGPLPKRISVELLRRINARELAIDEQDLQHIINAYDAEIRSMDQAFGRLVAFLKRHDLYDQTLIVFTSDHGEELNEHGYVGLHSHTLFDELLHVPLIVKYPGSRFGGTVVEHQVRSFDIPPTIIATVNIEVPREFMGVDLTPIAAGQHVELPAISRMDARSRIDISSIRTNRWKLNKVALFDLVEDPDEERDQADRNSKTVRRLERTLEEAVAERPRFEPVKVEVPEQTQEQLRALGYIQ